MTYETSSKTQQDNLKTLLKGMTELYGVTQISNNFRLSQFQVRKNGVAVSEPKLAFERHEGLTSASLIGHGPIFGVTGRNCESWEDYADKCFGLTGASWAFLCSCSWPDCVQEAIERLRMFIGGFDPVREHWHFSDRYSI